MELDTSFKYVSALQALLTTTHM